jgi:hypothetical protein
MTGTFFLVVSGVTFLIALPALWWGIQRAWRGGQEDYVFWRRAKVISALGGLLGLLLFLLSFEGQLRAINNDSKEYVTCSPTCPRS